MFQVAATYALAKDNNDECAFDFEHSILKYQGQRAIVYMDNVYMKLQPLSKDFRPTIKYKEPRFSYLPILYRDGMVLDGYFQSAIYFDHRKSEIQDLFIKENVIDKLKNTYKDILVNSVGVHVRRGDYNKFNGIHYYLPVEYYDQALYEIEKNHQVDNIIVSSDDIGWCKKAFKHPKAIFSVGLKDYEDLYLQSLCTHNIISNSSFGWWGAYLNKNCDKVVVAPAKWFDNPQGKIPIKQCDLPDSRYDSKDIYTPDMIRI